jgi:hypothetical protein
MRSVGSAKKAVKAAEPIDLKVGPEPRDLLLVPRQAHRTIFVVGSLTCSTTACNAVNGLMFDSRLTTPDPLDISLTEEQALKLRNARELEL